MELNKLELLQKGDKIAECGIFKGKIPVTFNSIVDGLYIDEPLVDIAESFSPVESRQLERIPITKEFLLENGFEEKESWKDYLDEDVIRFEINLSEYCTMAFNLFVGPSENKLVLNNCVFISLHTVDEFQRFMRICGYIDLANNVKVTL